MEILLQQAKIDNEKLIKEINTNVTRSLSGMSEPCFFPPHKSHYASLLYATKLTDYDIKQFVKRTWKGRKEAAFKLHNDPQAMFYIFLMHYFLKKKIMNSYKSTMILFMVRYYSNLANKSFPHGCKPDVFKYALNILTKTHLFFREKSISNAIFFLSTEMVRIWTDAIRDWNLERVSIFIQDSRNRISQSVKSFAETYYRISDSGGGIGTTKTDITSDEDKEAAENGFVSTQQDVDPRESIVDPIVKKIILYRTFDQHSFDEAKTLSKVNPELAKKFCDKLTDLKYSNNIRMILKLFLKDLTNMHSICGKQYYERIKVLMTIKRTKSEIYFKKEIQILIDMIVKDNKTLKSYSTLTTQTQFSVILFMALYITLFLKKTYC